MYAAGQRVAADCLPDVFATRSEAIAAGQAEVDRVAAIAADKRHHTIDWAVRFTVAKTRNDYF
jgi:hypothetical protein